MTTSMPLLGFDNGVVGQPDRPARLLNRKIRSSAPTAGPAW